MRTRSMLFVSALLPVALAVALALPAVSHAATFVADNTGDNNVPSSNCTSPLPRIRGFAPCVRQ